MQRLPYKNIEVMDCPAAGSEIIKYMREQRHDFMNHVQVIWGYLQLDKPKNALEYIVELNKKFTVFSQVFLIENPVLSLFLYKCIRRAYDLDISIDFDLEALNLENFLAHEYSKKLIIMEDLFGELINRITKDNGDKNIYIDVYNDEETLFIAFSNNCYDDWELPEELYKHDGTALDNLLENAYKLGIKASCRFDEEIAAVRIGLLPEKL